MRAGFNGTGYIQQRYNPRAHHNPMAAVRAMVQGNQPGQPGPNMPQMPEGIGSLLQRILAREAFQGNLNAVEGDVQHQQQSQMQGPMPQMQGQAQEQMQGQPQMQTPVPGMMENAAQPQNVALGFPALFAALKNQTSIGNPGPVRSALHKVQNNRGAINALIQAAMNSHSPGRMMHLPMQRPNHFAPGGQTPGGYNLM